MLAASLLLLSFAMLSRRRTQRLITSSPGRARILFLSTCLVAYSSGLTELYYSAALTLVLKVIVLPWILHRLISGSARNGTPSRCSTFPTTMLVGLVLVVFAFGLAQPISLLATTVTRNTSASRSPSSCSPS